MMDFAPLPVAMTIAALAGGVLAIAAGAAIALMTAKRPSGYLAATLCIALGVSILALPWLRTLPTPAPPPAPVIPGTITLSADARRTITTSPAGPPPPLPGRAVTRISIEASEAEPNDTLAGANTALLGISILGHVAEGDSDIFAFDRPDRPRDVIVASLTTHDASAALVLFDDAGRPLGTARTIDEIRVRVATLERSLDSPRYYVQVLGLSPGPASYQLTVAAERR